MQRPILGITAVSNRSISQDGLLSVLENCRGMPLCELFEPLILSTTAVNHWEEGVFDAAMNRASAILERPDVAVGACMLVCSVTEPEYPTQLQASFVAFSCRILGKATPVLLATPSEDYRAIQKMLQISYGAECGCGYMPPLLSLAEHEQVMSLMIDALQYSAKLI